MEPARLALALANSGMETDRLASPAGLRAWLQTHVPDGLPSDEVLLRLGDFRVLRDAVATALQNAVGRAALSPDVLAALNAASARAPTWPVLRVDGTAPPSVAMETSDTSETARILASVARSAIGLLGGRDAGRLSGCPACGRYFLRARSGQVWCSNACGNRTRVARHRARRTAAAAT